MGELGTPGGSLLTKQRGRGSAQELLRGATWGVFRRLERACVFFAFFLI